MGDGMAKYIQQDVATIADYDEYCHFVAGLVGVGLSQVQACIGMGNSNDCFLSECMTINANASATLAATPILPDDNWRWPATSVGVCMQLFASSGLETADFANMEELSNHMGLFLQVT